MQVLKENTMDTELENLIYSKLDDYLIIVKKTLDGKYCAMGEDEETKLRECFEYVVPWHK